MCVQDEKRIKESHGDFVNHMKRNNNKNFSNSPQSKKKYSHDSKASSSMLQGKFPMKNRTTCLRVYVGTVRRGDTT
jgi:hypothetical protein